jgi:hypothetical protein
MFQSLVRDEEMVFRRTTFAFRDAGILLLAIWLILTGVSGLVGFAIPAVVMAVLALVAGILLLLR